ncbi:MAG: AAA family ATPase [Deltaproteobacteria bacterium]|nr:AAA family ATPase [Deltaproteobacteria bacterium]
MPSEPSAPPERDLENFADTFHRLRSAIEQVVIGQSEIIEKVLIAIFAGGHVLLEGAPGLGKTLLVRTIAQSMRLSFSRIQFTPDLVPADILGTTLIAEGPGVRHLEFRPGPIFAEIVLADEINRATPKTQSALLEAMQEQAVTVGKESRPLPPLFFVLATQNPIEMEGTYPLPEAQLDRFLFKLVVRFPPHEALLAIAEHIAGQGLPSVQAVIGREECLAFRAMLRGIPLPPHVKEFAVSLIEATHPEHPLAPQGVRRFIRYGASPRGIQALLLGAKVRALSRRRPLVGIDDIEALAHVALAHRLVLNFEAEAEGINPFALIDEALEAARKTIGLSKPQRK